MIKGNIFSHLFQSYPSASRQNETLSFYPVVVSFFRILLRFVRIDPVQKGPVGCRLLLPAPLQEPPALLPTLHTLQSLPVSLPSRGD